MLRTTKFYSEVNYNEKRVTNHITFCFNPFFKKTDGCNSCILCVGVRGAFSIEKVISQS